MRVKKVLVTGEQLFIVRHQFIFQALAANFENLDVLPRGDEWYEL